MQSNHASKVWKVINSGFKNVILFVKNLILALLTVFFYQTRFPRVQINNQQS